MRLKVGGQLCGATQLHFPQLHFFVIFCVVGPLLVANLVHFRRQISIIILSGTARVGNGKRLFTWEPSYLHRSGWEPYPGNIFNQSLAPHHEI